MPTSRSRGPPLTQQSALVHSHVASREQPRRGRRVRDSSLNRTRNGRSATGVGSSWSGR